MEHLRYALTNCNYPQMGFEQGGERLTRPTREVNDGANSQGTTGTQPANKKLKPRVTVIPHTQGHCKSIKKICGGMVYKPTSKVIAPSKPTGLPQGQRPHGQQKWGHILVLVQ